MTTRLDIPGSNTSNPFPAPIQALLFSTKSLSLLASETATHLVATVTSSADRAQALCRLWDAFFMAVVSSSPSTHAPHLALLAALHAQHPTCPTIVLAGSDAELRLRSYSESESYRTVDVDSYLARSEDWKGYEDKKGRDVHDPSFDVDITVLSFSFLVKA